MCLTIDDVAKCCHEINRTYSLSIGDHTHKSWEETPEDIKASARNGVLFYLENPHASPEKQHEVWKQFKINQGWIYGEIKDSVKKTHPCIIEYNKLPLNQKIKDYLFQTIVHNFKDKVKSRK